METLHYSGGRSHENVRKGKRKVSTSLSELLRQSLACESRRPVSARLFSRAVCSFRRIRSGAARATLGRCSEQMPKGTGSERVQKRTDRRHALQCSLRCLCGGRSLRSQTGAKGTARDIDLYTAEVAPAIARNGKLVDISSSVEMLVLLSLATVSCRRTSDIAHNTRHSGRGVHDDARGERERTKGNTHTIGDGQTPTEGTTRQLRAHPCQAHG